MQVITYKQDPIRYNSYINSKDITDFKELLDIGLIEISPISFILASKRLDNMFRYKGLKSYEFQNMEFPRKDNDFNEEDRIPDTIKLCTYLLTLQGNSKIEDIKEFGANFRDNFRREKIGRTLELEKLEFDKTDIVNNKDVILDWVKDLINPYIAEFYICRG
jgi:hypothetical protein